jgi:hypothetical protein
LLAAEIEARQRAEARLRQIQHELSRARPGTAQSLRPRTAPLS